MPLRGKSPTCPEHGCEMVCESQPLWWRGKCGCPIRVFDEDREAYVPSTSIRWVASLDPDYRIARPGMTLWHRMGATASA